MYSDIFHVEFFFEPTDGSAVTLQHVEPFYIYDFSCEQTLSEIGSLSVTFPPN